MMRLADVLRTANTQRFRAIVVVGLVVAMFGLTFQGRAAVIHDSARLELVTHAGAAEAEEEGWPPEGDVAFVDHGDIYVTSLGGVRRITNTGSALGPAASPSIAPDGSVVYYTCARSKAVCWSTLDGGRSEALFWTTDVQLAAKSNRFKEVADPEISPDGKRLVFSSRQGDPDGAEGSGAGDIFVYELGSQTFSQITDSPDAPDVEPTWAPDGSLVWRSRRRIVHLGAGAGSPTPVTGGNQPARDPDISPDGKRLAVTLGGARARDIWTMNLKGGFRREVASVPVTESSPTWSPDGQQISYVTSNGAPNAIDELWTMSADGRNKHKVLTTPTGDVAEPSWGDIPPVVYFQKTSTGPCAFSDQPTEWCERVVTEPDSGSTSIFFDVHLTEPTDQSVSVTVAFTGKATEGIDYATTSRSVIFTPGQTASRVEIQVIGDTVPEPTESIYLEMSQPTNAVLGRAEDAVYIVDEDPSLTPPSPTPTGRDGVQFPIATVDAPSGENDYAAFPGTVDTLDGDLVVVYRVGPTHDINTGASGALYISRSSDLGRNWTEPVKILDRGFEPRDPALYRAPGTRRLYLTYFEMGPLAGDWRGLRLTYSDDDGVTWAHPRPLTTGVDASGASIRRGSDGQWRWPYYEWIAGRFEARLLTADDPLGPWSKSDVSSDPIQHRSEWDFVEVSPDNWIAVIRTESGQNPVVEQSTDRGRTWSAESRWSIVAGTSYDGWPILRLTPDGRVLCFIRGEGKGQRLVELLDPTHPLNPANWREPVLRDGRPIGALDRNGGYPVGKFDPVRIGDTWYGAYYYETSPQNTSQIRFGALDERVLGP